MGSADVENQLRKSKITLVIGCALVVAVLLAVYVPMLHRQHSAEETFRTYNRDMIQKNYSEAYDLLFSRTRNVGDLTAFTIVQQRMIEQHGELRGFEEGAIDTHLPDPAMVSIHETLIYEKDRVNYVMYLRKNNFFWEVWGVDEE